MRSALSKVVNPDPENDVDPDPQHCIYQCNSIRGGLQYCTFSPNELLYMFVLLYQCYTKRHSMYTLMLLSMLHVQQIVQSAGAGSHPVLSKMMVIFISPDLAMLI